MTVRLARPRKSYGLDGHSDLCAWVNSTHAPSLFARTKSFLFCHSLFLAVSLNCRFEPSLPLLVAEDELFITFNCLTSTFVLHLRPDARERQRALSTIKLTSLFLLAVTLSPDNFAARLPVALPNEQCRAPLTAAPPISQHSLDERTK